MEYDFEGHFTAYKSLCKTADEVFERVREDYPECVRCNQRCADCCHALFDLTLVEAMYINQQFNAKFSGKRKTDIIELANKTDRYVYKLKRQAYKRLQEKQASESQIIGEMATERARCPLLDDNDLCALYEYRPITCRLYGIPTAIGGKGHTCSLSGFVAGEPYPTVHLEMIQKKLYDISRRLVGDIQSRYPKLAEMLVPLSMALLTDFDARYLGVRENSKEEENRG